LPDNIFEGLRAIEPPSAEVAAVADAMVKVVDMPIGKRPVRTHIDLSRRLRGSEHSR
jgi:hypothetical protein